MKKWYQYIQIYTFLENKSNILIFKYVCIMHIPANISNLPSDYKAIG